MPQTELWLTPLILLPGVALLIMSTSVRFGQVHDEFHVFLDHPDAHARVVSNKHSLTTTLVVAPDQTPQNRCIG
jgi:hypothetical protein